MILSISKKISLLAFIVGSLSVLSVPAAYAATDCSVDANKSLPVCQVKAGVDKADGRTDAEKKTCGPKNNEECTLAHSIQDIINILLFLIGAIATIMIVIGGIRYTTSNGDSSQTTAAKNTILYAVVGLVVAIMAFAIVNWVIGSIQA